MPGKKRDWSVFWFVAALVNIGGGLGLMSGSMAGGFTFASGIAAGFFWFASAATDGGEGG